MKPENVRVGGQCDRGDVENSQRDEFEIEITYNFNMNYYEIYDNLYEF